MESITVIVLLVVAVWLASNHARKREAKRIQRVYDHGRAWAKAAHQQELAELAEALAQAVADGDKDAAEDIAGVIETTRLVGPNYDGFIDKRLL